MEISKQLTATKELDKSKEFLFSLNAHPISIFTFGAAESLSFQIITKINKLSFTKRNGRNKYLLLNSSHPSHYSDTNWQRIMCLCKASSVVSHSGRPDFDSK